MDIMNFEKKSQKPLKELVYLELKHKILTGEIPSQTRLMEVELSEKLNVSRTPVREAIKRLTDDGLVQMEARKGAYVAKISIKEMLDVFEIREDMEGFCAYLAAIRSTPEEKAALRELTEGYELACERKDKMEIIRYDEEIHNYIVSCCNNETLKQLVNYVQELSLRFRYLYYEDDSRYMDTSQQHIRLIEAIENGDADKARKLADQHVRAIREFVYNLRKTLEDAD